ncbi:alcohol dehydrogenase catalytic domain-containing protein [Candidatus Albibeggiatoa sp. nov. NOAA]|uniref:MDR/zinc-dependent alcohol dehydrogenase-like family protein n=1 Tax=Candidatus Albibeggiatoa sp. nov. NOAA TaxID=3162724 RepID=UPI0032F26BDE|nr:alcohol dehydrogenase catalytic domain-containing protein [Thiotrichaceae bacterium]
MQALWLESGELHYKDDVDLPTYQPDEALIRVLLAGICATDLQLIKGYYPFTGVLGHEFVGEVIQAPLKPEWIGRRVVGEINIGCGDCVQCLALRATHCENRQVLGIKKYHGAFAEYLSLPLDNLFCVPDNVPNEQAVFTEPLAAALEIQNQYHVKPTDTVLVIGAGRLGQLIAQTLALTGCHLQVVARYPKQQKLLKTQGIHWILETEIQSQHYDLIVEATGSDSGFKAAVHAVRPQGTIILKSTYKGDAKVNLSEIVVNEIQILGSRCGAFTPVLNLLAQQKLHPEILIDAQYSLAHGLSAFETAQDHQIMKVLLTP